MPTTGLLLPLSRWAGPGGVDGGGAASAVVPAEPLGPKSPTPVTARAVTAAAVANTMTGAVRAVPGVPPARRRRGHPSVSAAPAAIATVIEVCVINGPDDPLRPGHGTPTTRADRPYLLTRGYRPLGRTP
jgi:hypothetical protein